jgi:hypothetical protein
MSGALSRALATPSPGPSLMSGGGGWQHDDGGDGGDGVHDTSTTVGPSRQIEVHQNWLARLFRVKPATRYLCMGISRRRARQEMAILLREWRKYGIRDVEVDKERNLVFARVCSRNCEWMDFIFFLSSSISSFSHFLLSRRARVYESIVVIVGGPFIVLTTISTINCVPCPIVFITPFSPWPWGGGVSLYFFFISLLSFPLPESTVLTSTSSLFKGLNAKEVSFAIEIMTVIEHGKRNHFSIARFTQEKGAASSFHRVVDAMNSVFTSRAILVADKRKTKMMIKTLNS